MRVFVYDSYHVYSGIYGLNRVKLMSCRFRFTMKFKENGLFVLCVNSDVINVFVSKYYAGRNSNAGFLSSMLKVI